MKIAALLVTAVVCSAALGAITLMRRASGSTPWEYFPDMARSPAATAQSPNAYLPSLQTDQPPIEGTIAAGAEPLHYTTSVADFVRAGQELRSPFDEAKPPDLGRGRQLFQIHCQPCHGERAEGDGLVVRHGFPAPPSLLFGKAVNMKDGHLFYVISVGFRNMPSYAADIEALDRWQVIAYLRELQRP